MKIISLNPEYDTKELKEGIRKVIKEHVATEDSVQVSIVYYEVRTYKKKGV